MRLGSIASGSSGNCIYIGSDHTHILVDTGISKKRIEEGLAAYELSPKDLDGIFITHEHIDHISGLGVLTRKYPVPIYATKETIYGIRQTKSLGALDKSLFVEIEPEEDVTVGDLTVHPFSISHDALNPVAYTVTDGEKKAAVATDMGRFDKKTVDRLTGMNCMLVEANHDIHMLETGSYPYPLKVRIAGDHGHLSNDAAGDLINQVLNPDLKYIFLGHLSRENNYPQLAWETVRLNINTADTPYRASDFDLRVASRTEAGEAVEF
ncbi:MAG: MBL fold metallo-hydrolase [Lachnospiraceae bacterium]|nr:MBL fold metallo-hydrolase [Lachnospiraceae bacterium]